MSNLSVSPSQTDVERREAERETTLRYMAAQGFALMPMDALFLLSEIDRLRGALHESRKDREALIERNVGVIQNGFFAGCWYAVGVPQEFLTADEALAAYRAGNGETT